MENRLRATKRAVLMYRTLVPYPGSVHYQLPSHPFSRARLVKSCFGEDLTAALKQLAEECVRRVEA